MTSSGSPDLEARRRLPNTLVHLGVQGATSRALFSAADLKWVFLGCVLPDLPWILRRALASLDTGLDAYQLKLYAGAQASLAVTLLLCGALALVTATPVRVFAILAFNAFLHLLVDGLETKWANGVHFFAPLSWELWNARLGIWPEDPVIVALTVLGLGFFLWAWWRAPPPPTRWSRRATRYAGAACLFAAYALLPWPLRSGPASTDSYYLATLQAAEDRVGRYIEVDRKPFLAAERAVVADGEDTLHLVGEVPERTGAVSIRGRFTSRDTVLVYADREHEVGFRNGASYVGLGLLALYWGASWFGGRGAAAHDAVPRDTQPDRRRH